MISLVVGHSLTPASQEALRVAGDLAQHLGARLDVVHAVTLRDYPVDPDAADWDEQAQRTLAEQHEQVHAALDGCSQQWTYSVTRGDPVSLICSVAEKNDAVMIIVGTRGQGIGPAIERFFGGSVSHGLIRRQDRPVLMVRAPRSFRSDARTTSAIARRTCIRHGHLRTGSALPRPDHEIMLAEFRRA